MGKNRNRGFTVIELLVVIAILGTIMGVTYFKSGNRSRVTAGKVIAMTEAMRNIGDAAEVYFLSNVEKSLKVDPKVGDTVTVWKDKLPSSLADLGINIPEHPFGGAYGIQAGPGANGITITSTLPSGTGRAMGPQARIVSVDAAWDRAEMVRVFAFPDSFRDRMSLYWKDQEKN